MPDVFTKAKRSEVMSRIRGRGTGQPINFESFRLRRSSVFGFSV